MRYDLIVICGYSFNNKWQLAPHLVKRLKRASILYQEGLAEKIAVCGKWSIHWDFQKIKPRITESSEMKKYLVSQGVPANRIIKESRSKDTIGNLYYLKNIVVRPRKFKKLYFIASDFQIERLRFLVKKIFGPSYSIRFEVVKSDRKTRRNLLAEEKPIVKDQERFLSKMKDGDDAFLRYKLYKNLYYTSQYGKAPSTPYADLIFGRQK